MDSERFNHAITLRDFGREEEAIRELEQLATIESDKQKKGSLIHNKAVCLWRLGRLREARQCLSEAQQLWTNEYTEATDARLCVDEGNENEALQKLTNFFKQHANLAEPGDRQVYGETFEALGFLLFKLKRYAEAVEPITAALALSDNDQESKIRRFYLGICHLQIGNLELALRELTASLPSNQKDPLWKQAQFQLGELYFRLEDFHRSRRAFELAELFENDPESSRNISKWLSAVRARLREPEQPKM